MASAQAAYMQPNATGRVGPDTSNAPVLPSAKPVSARLYEDIAQGKHFQSLPQYMAAVHEHAMRSAAEQDIDVTSPKGQQWLNNVKQQARQGAQDFITPPPTKGTAIILNADQVAYDPYSHAEIGRGKSKTPPEVEAHDIAIAKHTAANEIATMEANAALHVKDPSELPDAGAGAEWSKVYDRVQREHNPGAVNEENAQNRANQAQQRIDEHVKRDGMKMTDGEKAQVKIANSDLLTAQRHFERATKDSQRAGTLDADAKLLNGLRSIVDAAQAKRDALFAAPVAPPAKEAAVGMDDEEPTPAPAAKEETVRVIDPNGKPGVIPKSQLAGALAQKYKLAPNGK